MVQRIDPAATRLLAAAHAELDRLGKTLVFTEASAWWQQMTAVGLPREAFFADDDFALEHGENLLLAHRFPDTTWEAEVPLAECALFAGLTAGELATLEPQLERRHYQSGQTIIAIDQASDELFVITAGAVMVSLPTQDGIARIGAFTSGMTFGELAFLDHAPRSANVTALGTVECRVLTRDVFLRLGRDEPAIKIRLLENIAVGLTGMLRQANLELAALK
jgi:Cyclic nucleotide-binding domain